MKNDYLEVYALYHGDVKIVSWKAPRLQTGDGSLYRLSMDRTLTDEQSKIEFDYYIKNRTNGSIKNAFEYLKRQTAVLNKETQEVRDLRFTEVKKLKSNEKFLEECFKRMDSYQEERRSYNTMNSIVFGSWNAMYDKYSSDSLKEKRRQLEKDSDTYQWNLEIIIRDIVGESIIHHCSECSKPVDLSIESVQSYGWNVRSAIDGRLAYSGMFMYKKSEETEISDEISKAYEKSRNIKLPLEG